MMITNKKLVFAAFFTFLTAAIPSPAQANPNAVVEGIVKFYFADIPVMADIARCESGFRQFKADGAPLYDLSGTYIGIFQIAERIHTPRAVSMGMDVRTIDGNLSYAKYLHQTSGTNPWKACVPKTTPEPVILPIPTFSQPSTALGAITQDLRLGQSGTQVRMVQQILNKNNFTIAASGPGSPGSETSFFGSLTREAIKRFQCAMGIVCSGTESATGFGRVGPQTRAALNSLPR